MPFEVSMLLGVLPIKFHSSFRPLLFEDMLESVLACQRESFLAVPYELVAEFPAEAGV